MNVGELFVSLGFDVDDSSLKEFNSKIVEGRNEILTMSAAATAAAYALNSLFENSAHNALQLKNFTDQTGYSAEALQKWKSVIHETNPSIGLDEAANGYKKLAQTLIDIRQGKGNSGALAMLGVTYDPNMTPEKSLEQIRAHLQQTIAQNGLGFVTDKLNAVGIGAGAINALELSQQEFDAKSANAAVTQRVIDLNVEYAKTIAALEVEWRNYLMIFTADWAGPVISAIKYVDDSLVEFHKNIHAVFEYIRQNQAVFAPIEAALAVLAGVWAIGTFPITAAFAALAFAINDVGRALRGLPTLTGGFVDTEKKGLHLLFTDPGQFLDNIDKSLDPLRRRAGVATSDSVLSNPTPATVNQTNNFHLSQHMSKEEIDSFIQDRVDDAHTQLNLGAPY